MATKERRRETDKKREDRVAESTRATTEIGSSKQERVDDSVLSREESTVEPDKTGLDVRVQQQRAAESVRQELYPSWGTKSETSYMYICPSRVEHQEAWATEWADFIVEWMIAKRRHTISITDFKEEMPFKELLDIPTVFRILGDTLVNKKKIAEWLDEQHTLLRVYWRPLKEWAHILYRWSLETGSVLLDLQSLLIQEADEDFATLPPRDLRRVMHIMVSEGLAEWVDMERCAVRIMF